MDLNAGNFEWLGKVTIGSCVVKSVIEAKEIKVSTAPGADFVFEDNYQLRDLKQVEEFIKEHKHLPDIPSAKEMEALGVDLAEMNMLLLMKLEELTLYSIDLEKEVKKQERVVAELETVLSSETKESEAINERLTKLEAICFK